MAEQETRTIKKNKINQQCRLKLAGQIFTKSSTGMLKVGALLPSCHTRELCPDLRLAPRSNCRQNISSNSFYLKPRVWKIAPHIWGRGRNCQSIDRIWPLLFGAPATQNEVEDFYQIQVLLIALGGDKALQELLEQAAVD